MARRIRRDYDRSLTTCPGGVARLTSTLSRVDDIAARSFIDRDGESRWRAVRSQQGLAMTSFATQHLDPGSHMGEALFGLIMTLTFTLGADLVIEAQGREGARQMLFGILGCNLAWGLIDGVLYVLGCAFEHGRLHRIGTEVQAANPPRAHRLVAAELDELLVPLTDEPQRNALYAAIVRRVKTGLIAPPLPVTRKDLLGGLESGLLVFACSIPAVLPFLLVDEPRAALRVSNAILLALLYYVGYRHARHTLARPWIAGLVSLFVGLFLVAVAIGLGG